MDHIRAKEKFDSCKHRPQEVVVRGVSRSCDSCPPKNITGYLCAELDIFPLTLKSCANCPYYSARP